MQRKKETRPSLQAKGRATARSQEHYTTADKLTAAMFVITFGGLFGYVTSVWLGVIPL